VLGVIRWRVFVEDRKKWKDIVRQAKAQSGLYCQWKKKKKLCAPINSVGAGQQDLRLEKY